MDNFRKTFITTQPGKAVWTAAALTLNLLRLPIWLIYFIPQGLRQHKAWSYKQAVRVRILKAALWNMSFVEVKTPLSLQPGAEKDDFVVVEPAAPAYYAGPTRGDPEVKPERIGGTWYPSAPGTSKMGFVVLHFHGGAYAIGDGRRQDAGFAANTLIKNTDATHVFAPQYRLSSNPGGRFPAQLQDAISCYVYLVDKVGVDPKKIVLSGDSAGANLVLSLTKYLAELGAQVGLASPGLAWLWSPWVSPCLAIEKGPSALNDNANISTDYLTGEFGVWGAKGLEPNHQTGLTIQSPYISFLGNPFKTDVPMYITVGECEVLLKDDTQLAEELKGVQGNKVGFSIEEHSVHDIILTGKILGFEEEAKKAARRANKFLKEHTRAQTNGKL